MPAGFQCVSWCVFVVIIVVVVGGGGDVVGSGDGGSVGSGCSGEAVLAKLLLLFLVVLFHEHQHVGIMKAAYTLP